jgi:hypothetical protein
VRDVTREEIETFVREVVRGAQHVVGERRREDRVVEQITDRWEDDRDDSRQEGVWVGQESAG